MRTTTRRSIIAGALALALTVSGCAGSRAAKDKAENNANGGAATGSATGSGGAQADSGGGMIPELTFPSDVDAAAAGLENYNPYAAKPHHGVVPVRDADDPERPDLRGHPVAGHQVQVGGRRPS